MKLKHCDRCFGDIRQYPRLAGYDSEADSTRGSRWPRWLSGG